MMMGHADGLRAMDLTVDGFWNSFFAIIVALPALTFSWLVAAGRLAAYDGNPGERMSLVVRFAVVDLGSWLLPLLALALLARRARIADRFVHYVVATNWASAVIIWIMLVPQIMRLIWPNAEDPITLVALVLFLLTLFLLWRVTNIAIGKGPAMGTAVFSGMFAGSLVVLFTLQPLLGLEIR